MSGAARSPASVAPDLVLVVRPGEVPLSAPGVATVALDLMTSDSPRRIAAGADRIRAQGVPLRARLPEVLFDEDAAWLRAVLALPWDGVYVRHLGMLALLPMAVPFVLEYPLQGLNGQAAGVMAGLAGRAPAAVVASPEASLPEIAALAADLEHLDPPAAVEVLAFGRQQVLRTRDQLGRAEGLYGEPGPSEHVSLSLEDAKGYSFPADIDAGGTRLFNARVSNVAANLGELREVGVTTFVVVQADFDDRERRAFAAGGLAALAPLAARERSTTGHLFRGVA